MKRSAISAWNFSFFILFSFYSIGSGMIESLLNYPSWYIFGPTPVWGEYRQLLSQRIIPLLAIPALLFQTISNILVIIYRPPLIPRWTAWTTLVMVLIVVVSSAIVQIPMQIALNHAYSKDLIDQLIRSDLYLRVITGLARGLIILYMLQCIVNAKLIADLRK